ncbi:MAG TPA: hypothetical protein DCG69_09570 [Bacteroidales bacterium]|nr:hypothetical protein [Bacteroidales bacterium]
MERHCLFCNESLMGRVDKKFCSDQCRNAYNNEKKAGKDHYVRQVNAILRKNRNLLESVCGTETKIVVNAQILNRRGFNYAYFTSSLTTSKGHIYLFCYEYGYLKLGIDKIMIVKRHNLDL